MLSFELGGGWGLSTCLIQPDRPCAAEGDPDNFLSEFIQQINYTESISILHWIPGFMVDIYQRVSGGCWRSNNTSELKPE